MKKATLVLIVFIAAFASAAEKFNDLDYAAVMSVVRGYDSAWLKKDVKRVEQVLAPEYIYFTSDGKITDRGRTLGFLKKESYKLDRSERTEIEIHRTGSTAVVSSRWIGTGSYDGKPIDDDQRCGIVLSQSKGRWLIVSEHCTQIVK